MNDVVLELCCGHCATWWVRWIADLDAPFDEQKITPEVVSFDVWHTHTLGRFQPATDGKWYRWNPTDLPEDELRTRVWFECPNGCPTHPQVVYVTFEAASLAALRYLHDTRTPVLRTTVDKLLSLPQ